MKFFNLSLLMVVLCTLIDVNANAQTVIKSRYILKDHMFSKSILSGGVSTGPEYDGGFGLQGMFDYRLAERFSVGVQGNLYFLESRLDEFRQLAVNARANYHLLKQHKTDPNYWDWYVGIDLGGDLEGSGKKIKEFNEFAGVHMGLRYKMNHRWIVFAEAGSRNASIGLALNLR
ncbi:hypothetical protein [Marinifilum sp. D714]|uniref:hypothetical protein n=1 Tax=Marinifilum sp. D714 TaxID=2937523 RepID=UPI0027CEF21E|nr:hypothetical protein [Marinifilum sp. D714]MDQ2178556.1 hypothetical protein [Marinifilum sp. D714]